MFARCCADASLLAVGDAAGTVSTWDARECSLLSAARAHDAAAVGLAWLSSAAAHCNNSPEAAVVTPGTCGQLTAAQVVSCGADRRVMLLAADAGIAHLYAAAFTALYNSCRRSNQARAGWASEKGGGGRGE
jgi:hypothetical protein